LAARAAVARGLLAAVRDADIAFLRGADAFTAALRAAGFDFGSAFFVLFVLAVFF
jgi:hypothetical protein